MSNPGNSALMLFIQERSWGKGHCWSSREQPLVIRKRWLFVQIPTYRDEGLHRSPGIHLLEWPATKSSTLGRTHFSPEKGTWGAREHRIIWFPTRLCSLQNATALAHHPLPSLPLGKTSYFLHCHPRRHPLRRHLCTRQARRSRSRWPGTPFGLRPPGHWRVLMTVPAAREPAAGALSFPAPLWVWNC